MRCIKGQFNRPSPTVPRDDRQCPCQQERRGRADRLATVHGIRPDVRSGDERQRGFLRAASHRKGLHDTVIERNRTVGLCTRHIVPLKHAVQFHAGGIDRAACVLLLPAPPASKQRQCRRCRLVLNRAGSKRKMRIAVEPDSVPVHPNLMGIRIARRRIAEHVDTCRVQVFARRRGVGAKEVIPVGVRVALVRHDVDKARDTKRTHGRITRHLIGPKRDGDVQRPVWNNACVNVQVAVRLDHGARDEVEPFRIRQRLAHEEEAHQTRLRAPRGWNLERLLRIRRQHGADVREFRPSRRLRAPVAGGPAREQRLIRRCAARERHRYAAVRLQFPN